mmetsp:Transcript_64105/g.152885  ORF Transcript_64105/g.152885 Transcript_64105/m.152885 type:complete len:80 (+) Transcript_64105:136-375(+)|eukprot:CAMPEP_0178403812 /NCGR_PEP_ID=MMETSP0689_2-20121128/17562_1 /TAXON_ID=160604 /ORGANISM="Amphidinium massartii, Strain CS-259" /LENGTH=79 /DNA_ID=CAMNT_0020024779 /DNA_START=125 /DNA_END=364 /DNA_ORIENTATION=+
MGFCNFLCSTICAFIIPPLGVFWRFGCGLELVICTILTLFCYFPGLIYAILVIGCDSPSGGKRSMPDSPKASEMGSQAA